MFSTHTASPFGRAPQFARAYKQIAAETGVAAASPHQLVAMLFDGFIESVAQARGAMQDGRLEAKGQAIMRAVRIVDEGLRAALNLESGGRLAADLHDLYGYLTLRLTQANLRNDPKALDECQRLVQPLREAWNSISGRVDRPDEH